MNGIRRIADCMALVLALAVAGAGCDGDGSLSDAHTILGGEAREVVGEPDGSCWGAWLDEHGTCRSPNDGVYPASCCEVSCLELDVDECEAHGCEVMMGHFYDRDGQCHDTEEVPVFCRKEDDIICAWQGDPMILTKPDDSAWYIPWSCFTTPEDHELEFVPDGKPVCSESE